MLKTLFLLMLAGGILSFGWLQAQTSEFGLKGGLNLSRLKTDDGLSVDSRRGMHIGVFAMMPSAKNEKLFLQLEAQFSQQGYDFFRLEYINIPILAKYYVTDRLSLHGGPQLGILVGAESRVREFFSFVDFSVPAGAEYDITKRLGLGVRYVLGVFDINDDKDDSIKVFNRVLQAFVSYRIITRQ